jgi:hypothetical protein
MKVALRELYMYSELQMNYSNMNAVCDGTKFGMWIYHNFFQILSLQMVQRFKEVLLDIVIQGILHIRHLFHWFSHLNESQTWNTLYQYSTKRYYLGLLS